MRQNYADVTKSSIVRVEITTFAGSVPGARHYYASLTRVLDEIDHENTWLTPKPRKKVSHRCPRLNTESSALAAARRAFAEAPEFAGASWLIVTETGVLDPARILEAPPHFDKTKANRLWKEFEDRGGWGYGPPYDPECDRIAENWNQLLIDAGLRRED